MLSAKTPRGARRGDRTAWRRTSRPHPELDAGRRRLHPPGRPPRLRGAPVRGRGEPRGGGRPAAAIGGAPRRPPASGAARPVAFFASARRRRRVNAGRELYERVPAFREALRQWWTPPAHLGESMVEALYPIARDARRPRSRAARGRASAARDVRRGACPRPAPEVPGAARSRRSSATAWARWWPHAWADDRPSTRRAPRRTARAARCRPSEARRHARAPKGRAKRFPPIRRPPELACGRGACDRARVPERTLAEPEPCPRDLRGGPGVPRPALARAASTWTGAALHAPERRQRVPLPTYRSSGSASGSSPSTSPLPPRSETRPSGSIAPSGRSLSLPEARQRLAAGPGSSSTRAAMGLARSPIGCVTGGSEVVTVSIGRRLRRRSRVRLHARTRGRPSHYARCGRICERRQTAPDGVLHLWGVESLDESAPGARERFERASDLGFYSLLHLAATRPEGPLALKVVDDGPARGDRGGAPGAREGSPDRALPRARARRHHDLSCGSIDVERRRRRAGRARRGLLAELSLAMPEPVVALSPRPAMGAGLRADPAAAQERIAPRLREGGVYLITGGLGDVGYVLGLFLAHEAQAKLVLTGRSGLAAEGRAGPSGLETHDAADETTVRIRKVQALEALGAEVLVLKADAASAAEMQRPWSRPPASASAPSTASSTPRASCRPDTFRAVRGPGRGGLRAPVRAQGPRPLRPRGGAAGRDAWTWCCSPPRSPASWAAWATRPTRAPTPSWTPSRRARTRRAERVWVSVDWDQWEFAGREAARDGRGRPFGTGRPCGRTRGSPSSSAILRLRDLDRVVVSTAPLRRPSRALGAFALLRRRRPALPGALHARVRRSAAPYVAPGSETERVAGRHLAGAARHRGDRHPRRLLRAGRSLAVRGAAPLAGAGRLRRVAAPGGGLRRPDGGGAGRPRGDGGMVGAIDAGNGNDG